MVWGPTRISRPVPQRVAHRIPPAHHDRFGTWPSSPPSSGDRRCVDVEPMSMSGVAGAPRHLPLGLLIARVGRQVDRAFDDALAAADGSRSSWLILLAVKTGAGGTQAAIAERVGISGPTLIHHLDRLQAAGLITRNRDA